MVEKLKMINQSQVDVKDQAESSKTDQNLLGISRSVTNLVSNTRKNSKKIDESPPNENERVLTNAFDRLTHDLIHNTDLINEYIAGKRIGFYTIGNNLGNGNFSQVKLGVHLLTKERVAIKILEKTKLDEKTQRLLYREIGCMEKLHHPNIIRLYEVINTPTRLHIIMEYAAEGELYTKINRDGKLNDKYCKYVYSQIIAAVNHMHTHNIVHRDIKAENVFFASSRTVKVGDFGFSTHATKDQQLNTFCGSPPYAAPELFRDDSYIGIYVDVWALGVLLYFMLTSMMPFKADTVGRLKRCILNGEFFIPSYVSDSCQLLIRGILKPVPADRFTIKEIMESAWLDNQKFPSQLDPYQLTPTAYSAELKLEEKLSRQYLETLGISQETLISNSSAEKVDLNTFENSLVFTPETGTSASDHTNMDTYRSDTRNNEQSASKDTFESEEFKNSINGTYRIAYHRIQKQLRKKYSNGMQALVLASSPLILKQNSSTQLANPPKPTNVDSKLRYEMKQTNLQESQSLTPDSAKILAFLSDSTNGKTNTANNTNNNNNNNNNSNNNANNSARSRVKIDTKDEVARQNPKPSEPRQTSGLTINNTSIDFKRMNIRSKSTHKTNQQVSKTCSII